METPGGKQVDPESVGQHMAAEMLKNMVLLNERLGNGQEISSELVEKVDTLIGHFEVFGRSMEIICEKASDGKSKWSLKDFAEAYLEAADEIMPEDDGEDEHGPEDPLVRSR